MTSILYNEIMQLKKPNFVYMVYRTVGAVNAPGGGGGGNKHENRCQRQIVHDVFNHYDCAIPWLVRWS